MLHEYQSPEARAATVEDSYSYNEIAGRPYLEVRTKVRSAADSFLYRVIKRSLDVMLVIASIPVTVPILLIVSLLVKLTSRGPIFYSHRRIRKSGLFFSMWKFRTMCQNSTEVLEQHLAKYPKARAEWNRTHKLRKDPRITRVGSFLRQYSVDELPQLWNVLTGQMSLVGPRPIVAAEVEKYGDCFGCYCEVKPGLTGLWQVSGRSKLTYAARVALDCEYVRRWSLMRDVLILSKTFRVVVRKDGAF
jgi:Undecaprenyl-phosphate galactose phosphotransferase WbaP